MPNALPRRRLLAGAAVALATGGCDLFGGRGPAVPPAAADALEPVLAAELELIARYDAVLPTVGGAAAALRGVRAEHVAHAQALRALLDPRRARAVPSPQPVAVGGAGAAAVAGLAAAEQAAARRLTAAAITAPADRAELLASIAASEASHAVVFASLRGGAA